MRNVQFVAVDVDDQGFHVAVIHQITNEIQHFACKPDASTLAGRIEKRRARDCDLRICYEATHLGFSLCRALRAKGYHCDVIAPSLIPNVAGKAQKTDRLDAKALAEYYMKGLLTTVHVPEFEDEQDRDFVRSRRFLVEQMTALKNHITALCKRLGWDYRNETRKKHYWTKSHVEWLEKKAKEASGTRLALNLRILLRQYEHMNDQISLYDEEIDNMATEPHYAEKVKSLVCYRGIATGTAMTVITEIGDIKRFDHPRRITSYVGYDLREYTSSGKQRQFGISKNGNRHIRAAVTEACQLAFAPPKVSKALKERRKEAKAEYVDIADRCMARLYKKGGRLVHRGKHRNVAKTACAREMLCFIWESLRAAA